MKTINLENAIYLAGFIDADGSIFAQIIKNPTVKNQFQIRVVIQITQIKQRTWFLEKVRALIGAGTIKERIKVHDYVLNETKTVYLLLKQIQPFLIIKKKQANLLIQIIERLPSSKDSQDNFLEICKMVDHVATLNNIKTRKNTFEIVLATLTSKENVIIPVETSDKN